jgi:hypothetical protein
VLTIAVVRCRWLATFIVHPTCSPSRPSNSAVRSKLIPCPTTVSVTFGDLTGKLYALEVACDKCARKGRYALASLVRYRMVAFRQ